MKIHATLSGSRANGPGVRSVIWTQGCVGMGPSNVGPCLGCWNPLLHPIDSPLAEEIEPDALAERVVREAVTNTTGITISGGEPLQQAVEVYSFMCSIHARRPWWNIGLFSGYTLSELELLWVPYPTAQQQDTRLIWEHQIRPRLAWAILGRYEFARSAPEDRPDLPWRHAVSSANQTLHLFTSKYAYTDFPPLSLEVSIDETGLTNITGFPMKGI